MASVIRTAKLFRNGGSRAIRLPKDLEISGDEVVLKQDFGVITIFPKHTAKGSLLSLLKALGPIDLAPREQPEEGDTRADRVLRAPRKKPSKSKNAR
jgi:antitoxin VapB